MKTLLSYPITDFGTLYLVEAEGNVISLELRIPKKQTFINNVAGLRLYRLHQLISARQDLVKSRPITASVDGSLTFSLLLPKPVRKPRQFLKSEITRLHNQFNQQEVGEDIYLDYFAWLETLL